jgi:NAD(P)-dependent dehydrogenase (short-subunit alcohol dehydrogenase family)
VKFVKCDVTSWEDQLKLFAQAALFTGKVDYVIANAGIFRKDEVFTFSGEIYHRCTEPETDDIPIGKDQEPMKPDLAAVDVNLKGTLYTTKLALHYFVKQNGELPSPQQEENCLVLIGSGAAFLDCPRGPVYPSTKWGVRGIMHSMRRTAFYHGGRVNMISPWYYYTLPYLYILYN